MRSDLNIEHLHLCVQKHRREHMHVCIYTQILQGWRDWWRRRGRWWVDGMRGREYGEKRRSRWKSKHSSYLHRGISGIPQNCMWKGTKGKEPMRSLYMCRGHMSSKCFWKHQRPVEDWSATQWGVVPTCCAASICVNVSREHRNIDLYVSDITLLLLSAVTSSVNTSEWFVVKRTTPSDLSTQGHTSVKGYRYTCLPLTQPHPHPNQLAFFSFLKDLGDSVDDYRLHYWLSVHLPGNTSLKDTQRCQEFPHACVV